MIAFIIKQTNLVDNIIIIIIILKYLNNKTKSFKIIMKFLLPLQIKFIIKLIQSSNGQIILSKNLMRIKLCLITIIIILDKTNNNNNSFKANSNINLFNNL
jgi:hypothetical protein